jgi:histidyl-tRNA synthetase
LLQRRFNHCQREKARYHDAISRPCWSAKEQPGVLSSQHLDTRQFSQLLTSLEQHMAAYGYRKVDTPIIQPADLFLTRAGDQIIDHLFTFERRGQHYALRPEFTASAASMFAQQQNGQVARWQFSGPVFEDRPAYSSNSYQRFGIGAELIGMAGTLAEAEILALATHGLTQQSIENWTLTIGHVQLMRHLLASHQLDSRAQHFLLSHLPALRNPDQGKAYVLEVLDKLVMGGDTQDIAPIAISDESSTENLLAVLLDGTQRGTTMGGRTRHDIVRRLLQKRQRAAERDQFVRALDFLEAWSEISASPDEAFDSMSGWIAADDVVAQAIFQQWRRLIDLLSAYGIPSDRLRLQPALARNWDYYTGVVFELHTQDHQELGGGGRYDELARLLGAEHDIPAVGFTYYADQLLARLPKQQNGIPPTLSLIVTAESELAGVSWGQALRQRGCPAIVANSPPADTSALYVQPNGSIQWAGSSYTLETVDQLIAHMERIVQ